MVRVLSRRWARSLALCGAIGLVGTAVAGPIEDAKKAYEAGEYTLAASLYEQAAQATPALRQDKAFVSAWDQAEARVLYATGSILHAEGAYDAAADQFLLAIAKDSTYQLAYAALEDAQRAGVRQHLVAAIAAADTDDLLTARQRLERSLVLGGGADAQVKQALASILEPDKAFDQAALAKLAQATALSKDKQWGLAQEQLQALAKQAPLLLPARAELSRATRYKTMSIAMTDEAAALIAQQRLSPALEQLAGATTVWPYNDRAATLLGSVEAKIKRAHALVDEAQQLKDEPDWRGANEKIVAALAIDPSNAKARAMRSEVRIGLVKMLGEQARAALDSGDNERARALIDRADQHWPNNRWTRKDLSHFQLTLSERAAEAGHTGEAYLRALLAVRDNPSVHERIKAMETQMLRDAGATFAYNIATHTPVLGVSSGDLASALSTTRRSGPAQRVALNGEGNPPRYVVRVRITDTDIDLRQRSNGATINPGTNFGNTATFSNPHYWEKYGTVEARVRIIDTATDRQIDSWRTSRWASYTDRQQYVIGNSWNTSYWTLPTDEAVAARLADDLADQMHAAVTESVTLARARAMRNAADEQAKEDPAGAMDTRVSAVVLAGQINARDARRELRRMSLDLDKAQPSGQGE